MSLKRKKTTMQDIATKLGISKNSVSLALSGKTGVGDDLRKQIFELAAQMNYQGYQNNQTDKIKCIIVIVPEYLHNDSFFYHDIFWSIESEAKQQGCIPINMGVSVEMESKLILPVLPIDMDVCGLLVVGVLGDSYIKALYNTGLPMLTVDISYNCVPVSCIGTSNINGGFLATQHLIDNGHKNIGFVGSIYNAQSVYERWCGFKQALLKNDITDNDRYHILGENGMFNLIDTIDKLEPWFDKIHEYPTAWFCAGDRIAIALINLLIKRKIKIPGEISVMGFDDIPVGEMISPQLTTVKIDRKLMGRLAVERLMNSDSNGVVNVNLVGSIIVRDSVKNILHT